MKNSIPVLFLLLLISAHCVAEDWQTKTIKLLNGGSAVVQDQKGNHLFSYNADKQMVPASILKIATADTVLSLLGEDYRINTEFYLTPDNYLGIKGFGDPGLVSESLLSIAKQLKNHLNNQSGTTLKGFWLDTDFFKSDLKVHGQSSSNNPYDSSLGALVANFNTVHIYKTKKGKVTSAEPQTPLTATAIQLAKNLPPGKHRINIGKQKQLSLRYFSELLQVFLKRQGITIPVKIINKKIPQDAAKLFTYKSQHIAEIIKKMLLFSNNFIANQLLIILGGEQKGAPADLDKGKQVVSEFLINTIGINTFTLEEGSGLSRKNQFSANQIMRVLIHFRPYQQLLRIDKNRFQAKTGTLQGISTYAGYMFLPSGESYPFVIMLNKSRWGRDRNKIANIMYNGVK